VHKVVNPKVLYFGTPVVLISSINSDGSANLAPISSAWWLGRSCMLGLDATSKTTENLRRTGDCVLNLPGSHLVDAVDRLALLTGSLEVPEHKRNKGFRYEPEKFKAARLTPEPSDLVRAPRAVECSVQLEGKVVARYQFGTPHAEAEALEVSILRVHVDETILIPGTSYIDPLKWDPLIMKFTEFFGHGINLRSSTLARGFGMQHNLSNADERHE
jgi:flavin reductase (DIM6/NTAB) family NADH-FMN oxidoreductase RutF